MDAENSAPLNFDTFVPTHDPSLASHDAALPPMRPGQDFAAWAQTLASSSVQLVDQDEAFQHALTAMYWTGYYTAVYQVNPHCDLQGRVRIQRPICSTGVRNHLRGLMMMKRPRKVRKMRQCSPMLTKI